MVGKIHAHLRVSNDDEVGGWNAASIICDICECNGWFVDDSDERQRPSTIHLYISRDVTGGIEANGGCIGVLTGLLEALEARKEEIGVDVHISIDLY